jgi:hypothetical protein
MLGAAFLEFASSSVEIAMNIASIYGTSFVMRIKKGFYLILSSTAQPGEKRPMRLNTLI